MEYKYLGNTGIKVSEFCFGTMSFGAEADEATSAAMFNYCRDQGINFFDCANVYAGGTSEEILGRLIADCRDQVVLTSKVYFPMGKDPNAAGSSRYNITNALEASLGRLNTDRIDVYFLHRFDDNTPLETTLRALDDLVSQGKILSIGVSNFAAWQIAKALGISTLRNWAKIDVVQPMYNLVKRQAEVEILPLCEAENLGVMTYSPLGAGLLTGKYGLKDRPDQGRLVDNMMYKTRYGDDWVYQVAEDFTQFAKDNGYNPVSLAVAWVKGHPTITCPIVGARNVDQLKGSLAAAEIDMTAELRERIAALSPEPAPATDRSEEQTEFNFSAKLTK